jgi:hypothetical protein
MTKLWVDPPEGWKHGFPAIYDSETDGQMSEWIVNKGYPVQTIKEYGVQWHIRCWPAEEPEKYPDQVINAQKHSEVIKNAPIGTDLSKKTRRKVTDWDDDDIQDYKKPWVGLTEAERYKLWLTTPSETENRFAFAKAIEQALKEKNT